MLLMIAKKCVGFMTTTNNLSVYISNFHFAMSTIFMIQYNHVVSATQRIGGMTHEENLKYPTTYANIDSVYSL